MDRLNPLRTGLATGLLIALWHAIWLSLVATGLAQRLIDWIFWMHLIRPVYVVQPFAVTPAAMLLLVTFLVGLGAGSAFAVIWNRLHPA